MKRNRGWISTATEKVVTIRDLKDFPLAKRDCAWPSGKVHNEELGRSRLLVRETVGGVMVQRNAVPIVTLVPRAGVV